MKPGQLFPLAALLIAALLPLPAQDAPKLDFGDNGSATITGKAWAAHAAKNVAEVKGYVARVRELYEATAIQQQASLTAPVPTDDKEKVHSYWALNDVGTSLFILGQTLEQSGDKAGALAAYKVLVDKLSFAQCWDEKGWFWRPAEAARGRIKALEFDAAE
jgi:hypothetical protein